MSNLARISAPKKSSVTTANQTSVSRINQADTRSALIERLAEGDLRNIKDPQMRVAAFQSIQRKYGNDYATQIARSYQTTTADSGNATVQRTIRSKFPSGGFIGIGKSDVAQIVNPLIGKYNNFYGTVDREPIPQLNSELEEEYPSDEEHAQQMAPYLAQLTTVAQAIETTLTSSKSRWENEKPSGWETKVKAANQILADIEKDRIELTQKYGSVTSDSIEDFGGATAGELGLNNKQAKKLAKVEKKNQKYFGENEHKMAGPTDVDYDKASNQAYKLYEDMTNFKNESKQDFDPSTAKYLIERAKQILGGLKKEPEKGGKKEKEFANSDKFDGTSKEGKASYGKDPEQDDADKDKDKEIEFSFEPMQLLGIIPQGAAMGAKATGDFEATKSKTGVSAKGGFSAYAGLSNQQSWEANYNNGKHDLGLAAKHSEFLGGMVSAEGSGSAGLGGISVKATGEAFVGAKLTGTVKAHYLFKGTGAMLGGSYDLNLGAGAKGNLEAALGLKGVSFSAQGEAFAGIDVNVGGKVNIKVGGRTWGGLEGRAGFLLGAGAKGGLTFKFSVDEIGLDLNGGVAAGAGFSGKVSGNLSPSQVQGSAKELLDYLQNYKAFSKGYDRLEPLKLDPRENSSEFSMAYRQLTEYLEKLNKAATKVQKKEDKGTMSLLGSQSMNFSESSFKSLRR